MNQLDGVEAAFGGQREELTERGAKSLSSEVDLDAQMWELTVLARVRLRSAFVLHLLQGSVFTVGALTVGE